MDASDPSTVWATQAYFVGPEQADANILGGNSSADSGAVAAVRVDRQEEEGEIDDIVRLANQADTQLYNPTGYSRCKAASDQASLLSTSHPPNRSG